MSPTGYLISGVNGYPDGGLSNAMAFNPVVMGMVIDAGGNVWVGGTGQVAEFDGAGQALPASPYQSADLGTSLSGGTSGMAVDPSGDIWLAHANVTAMFNRSGRSAPQNTFRR